MKAPVVSAEGRMSTEVPSAMNGLSLYSGSWKFDFDQLSRQEIEEVARGDRRPPWCAETFPDFHRLRVVELGPADGYNSLALEMLGVEQLTAIEGNVDCFLRCLILKNALGMKTTFQLGDFTRMFDSAVELDLLYASGVLYHLPDPVEFIHRASQHSQHLFLWTHLYDEEAVQDVGFSRNAFSGSVTSTKTFEGRTYTYHRYEYDVAHVANAGYAGGLRESASWITRDDLEAALAACGYQILRVVDDDVQGLPVVNLFASLR